MSVIPCKNCISLAICKSKSNIRPTLIECVLIQHYIFGAGQGVKGTRFEILCDFFQTKRFIRISPLEKKILSDLFRFYYRDYKARLKSK